MCECKHGAMIAMREVGKPYIAIRAMNDNASCTDTASMHTSCIYIRIHIMDAVRVDICDICTQA